MRKKEKKAVLYCKCKMCEETFTAKLPYEVTENYVKNIATHTEHLKITHDCGNGQNPIKNAYGVGEVIGIKYV